MKTINKTQILMKSIDIELKKLIESDLKAFRASQAKGNNQGAKKAA